MKKLFETKPGLYNFIHISHLFKPQGEQNQTTILHNFLDPENGIEISNKLVFLREFFDKNPSLAQDFTIEHLCNIRFFYGDLFYTLCMSAEGIAFLQYVFDKNSNLLDQLPISALFGANIYNARRFYAISLLMIEPGLELIRTIFKKSSRFSNELTINDILSSSINIIEQLIQQQAYDIFELMFENNPKLVIEFSRLKSITDPTLKAIIEKYLANALRNPTEKEKAYLDQFLSMRASEKSLLAFLDFKDAVDYLLNIRVNDSNVLSELAVKNPTNLSVLLKVLQNNPHLLQKFSNPALFRVRGNQGGDFETKSTLDCLQTQPAGKELIELLFEKPKTIRLRNATVEEQKQLGSLCLCKSPHELRMALTEIKNISAFFNEIIFDLTPLAKTKASLIVSISTYDGDPDKFPKLKNFTTLLYGLLQADDYIRAAIYSESFFSLVESQSPDVQTTGALATIRFDCKPFIKSAIREHLIYNTQALACLLDNFFLKGQFENTEFRIFGFLLNQANNLDINLIVSLILQKYRKLSDEQTWQQLCQPISLSNNECPLLILTIDALYIDILKELFNKKPSFYQFITAEQLLREYPIYDSSESPFP